MSKKHKKVGMTLKYVENLFILLHTILGYISVSVSPLLVGIPVGIASSAVGLIFFFCNNYRK